MQVNGWELFAHPLLLDQLDKLMAAVEKEKSKKPKTYPSGANFKVLAAVRELMFVTIPADPTRPDLITDRATHSEPTESTGSGPGLAGRGFGSSSDTTQSRRSSSTPG